MKTSHPKSASPTSSPSTYHSADSNKSNKPKSKWFQRLRAWPRRSQHPASQSQSHSPTSYYSAVSNTPKKRWGFSAYRINEYKRGPARHPNGKAFCRIVKSNRGSRRMCGVLPPKKGENLSASHLGIPRAQNRLNLKKLNNTNIVQTMTFSHPQFAINGMLSELSEAGFEIRKPAFAKGLSSKVFYAQTPKRISALRSKLLFKVGSMDSIPTNTGIAIKIKLILNKQQLIEAERGSRIQAYVASKVRNVTPALYFAAFSRVFGVHISIMKHIDGVPLTKLIAEKRFTAEHFLDIEKKLLTLWRIRVYHGDAHPRNLILVSNNNVDNIYIIDFDNAFIIPAKLAPKTAANTFANNFKNRLANYANKAFLERHKINGKKDVYDNVQVLRSLLHHLMRHNANQYLRLRGLTWIQSHSEIRNHYKRMKG